MKADVCTTMDCHSCHSEEIHEPSSPTADDYTSLTFPQFSMFGNGKQCEDFNGSKDAGKWFGHVLFKDNNMYIEVISHLFLC